MNTKTEKPLSAAQIEYRSWVNELKSKFQRLQLKAAVAVNTTLLEFYWELGKDILDKQRNSVWGDGFLAQLSRDLSAEFPEIKGFSKRNLEQIRRWVHFWSTDTPIAKQAASQLFSIPWWHNVVILSKCDTQDEAHFYVQNTLTYGWSRNVLTHQIENRLWQREGKIISNFQVTLPQAQSDLAKQSLKDPYIFDFLSLTKEHTERELENALTQHITQFLLELGAGFAYIGRQVPLQVGERDFFIDLLFYHTRLHCYVVIELKTVDFEPEHAGKLNFYIKAVDEKLRHPSDQATIGLLLCKSKDKLVAEYALSDIYKPIGISSYELSNALPDPLKASLPSIEQLEFSLSGSIAKSEQDI